MSGKEVSYTWTIEDVDLFNKIMSSKNGQTFHSDIFVIEDLKWRIEICPNGYKPKQLGSFQIYVKLISLPELWKRIVITRSIECPQTHSGITVLATYDRSGHSRGWATNTLRLKEIKELKLNKIIVTVKTKILRIILKKNGNILYNYKFKNTDNYKQVSLDWKLDRETLQIAKRAYNGKCIVSDIFSDIWCIKLLPNGSTAAEKGQCMLGLQICTISFDHLNIINSIDIETKVSIAQFNFTKTQKHKYRFLKGSQWVNVGTFAQLQNCDEFSINLKVLILKEYDSNESEIGSETKRYVSSKKVPPNMVLKSVKSNGDKLSKPAKAHKSVSNQAKTVMSPPKMAVLNQEKSIGKSQTPPIMFKERSFTPINIKAMTANTSTDMSQYKQEINAQLSMSFAANDRRIKEISTNMSQKMGQMQRGLNQTQNKQTEMDYRMTLYDSKIKTLSENIEKNMSQMQQTMQIVQTLQSELEQAQSLIMALNNGAKDSQSYKERINYQMSLYDTKIKSFSLNVSKQMKQMQMSVASVQNKSDTNDKNFRLINNRLAHMFEQKTNESKQENDSGTQLTEFEELRKFFETELELPQYLEPIMEAGFEDISSLSELTNGDLKEIDVKIAHRHKILQAIQQKQESS